ncbi:MAG: tetratricopeptide repeat protein [Gallionella sp.]|nr:tetratricopeptide repeat protein [Gallionella sp.]
MNGTGRNDPCPCGSGKKYKHCCARRENPATAQPDEVSGLLQAALEAHKTGQQQPAESLCRRVLQITPDHPDALHLLGLFARQAGNHELAVELISRAAERHPVAPFFFNLGNAYQALGRMDEAVASFNRALALNPGYVAALNNLGIALQHQGKLEEAINAFRSALALQPGFAELYSNLGDALRENGQLETAAECARHAISLNPAFFNAHFCLGKILHEQGHSPDALACFKQALTLNPGHVESHLAACSTYFAEGRFTESREHIERALQQEPDNPEAWAALAFFRKMTPDDEAWVTKAHALLAGKLKPREAIQLNYALGKYYDDTAQYAQAFPHYAEANRMQTQINGAFDRDNHQHLVDSIIAAATPAAMRRHNAGASLSERPVLIVGMPRSGTSLMEQILASHSKVHGAGELRFWSQAATDHFASVSCWSDDAALLSELAGRYKAELAQHSPDALRVVDKMPANFMNLGLIHAAFPNARIIHMMRNPLDTCLSIFFQGFSGQHPYANSLEDLASYYRTYRQLMQHWRSVLAPDIFLEAPYEALVEDQESWSRRVVEFIGLEWDENCLNFHQTERRVGTASNWQVRQKIYKTSTERWRNYQTFIEPLLPLLEDTP